MARQPIKFKTVLSNFTKGGKPCYAVRVVNNGTRYLKDADEIAEIAREINMSVPFARTTCNIVLEKMIDLALQGYIVSSDEITMRLTVRDGFDGTGDKWNPSAHSLRLIVTPKSKLREKMAGIEFVNVTEGIKVTIYSVGDEIYAEDGVIAGTAGETVSYAGDNILVTEGREDEFVAVTDREGTVVQTLAVTDTTEQTGKATLAETLPPGDYRLMIASRNGAGLDRGVGVAYKNITVKGPKA